MPLRERNHNRIIVEIAEPIRLELVHVADPLDAVLALLRELKAQGEQVVQAIADFAAKVSAHNDKIDAAVTGLTGDVAELNRQIAALQNSAGTLTPEDQALLDGIESRSQGVADKLDALDALTPPVPA